jgi:hypothetical protein
MTIEEIKQKIIVTYETTWGPLNNAFYINLGYLSALYDNEVITYEEISALLSHNNKTYSHFNEGKNNERIDIT